MSGCNDKVMEEDVFRSWLGACASAPLVMVLALWTSFVFHTYRASWRTVDLFLVALIAQEFLSALFAFAFSLISLVGRQPEAAAPPCEFVLWGLLTTRVFQACTLASLVVDRALTVRWPYRYRFSVRRNQIRYHIAVTCILAVFVGIAGVFARVPSTQQQRCSLRPARMDTRFLIFLFCLYAFLLATVLVCSVHVELHRRCRSRTPPLPCKDCGSATTTSSSSSSAPHESHRPYCYYYAHGRRRPLDFRWAVVAAVAVLSCVVNHLPYGVSICAAAGGGKAPPPVLFFIQPGGGRGDEWKWGNTNNYTEEFL